MQYRTLIVNEGESPNLGDQAINFCMEELLVSLNHDVVFAPYSNAKSVNIKSYVRPKKHKALIINILRHVIPKTFKKIIFSIKWRVEKSKLIKRYLNESDEIDVAIIGGGQLLNLNRVFPISLNLWTTHLADQNIPIYMVATGYGESWKGNNKKKLVDSLKRIKKSFLRENNSIIRIKNETNISCSFVYDVAFSISDFIPSDELIKNSFTILPASYVNVVKTYNPNLTRSQYLEELINICLHHRGLNRTIRLSITDLNQDKQILDDLSELLSENSIDHIKLVPKNLRDLCSILSSSQVVNSGRMHALIIAYSYDRVAEPVLLSNKLINFKKEILDSSVPINTIKENIKNVLLSI